MAKLAAIATHNGPKSRTSSSASLLHSSYARYGFNISLNVNNRRKLLLRLTAAAVVLSIYPLFVLLYTWTCVYRSDLEGGRNGPLDAYRHTLASAVVSYTLDERAVNLVTRLMESKGKNSNTMDRHNNRIGAQIGATSKSFKDLEPTVLQSVQNGTVNSTNTDQITWLPKEKWRKQRLW